MARLHPGLDELDQLPEPLNDAELEVARVLAGLDDGWSVFIQPRIGLDRPDFVAVHRKHGVCAIEVKGWTSARRYRQRADGAVEYRVPDGGWKANDEQPRYQALRYRRSIWDLGFAGPTDSDEPKFQVRGIVVFPFLSTKEAERLTATPAVTPDEKTIKVLGGDGFRHDVARALTLQPCSAPSDEQLARLGRQLTPSSLHLQLSDSEWRSTGSRNIERNPSNARIRRVKGAAGSGKTYGLAARAARLAAEGNNVLVLCYNRTLTHYLRMLVDARCQERGANRARVTCSTFHALCHRLVEEAERHGHELPTGTEERFDRLIEQAQAAGRIGLSERFDAVLIDEGQDFELTWWNLLREHVVRPGGEMLLVADPTQDLYERTSWTDEERMLGAGFSGPWTVLRDSHRIPGDLVSVLSQYSDLFLSGDRVTATMPTETLIAERGGSLSTTVRDWRNIGRGEPIGRAVGAAVVELLQTNSQLSPDDATFLVERHDDGLEAVQVIEAAGYDVHHMFGRSPAEKTRRKQRFWPDSPGVRGSTIHSFKGWESRAVVVGIGPDTSSPRNGYVALTRVLGCGRHHHSFATVVNQHARLVGFEQAFSGWQPPHAPLQTA